MTSGKSTKTERHQMTEAKKETAAQKKKREAEEAKAQEAAQAAAEEEAAVEPEPEMLPDEDIETKQSSLDNLREWADEAARNGATFEEAKQVLVDSNLPAED